MGDDPITREQVEKMRGISIHVPRVGDDRRCRTAATMKRPFLSTSPAWGTTDVHNHSTVCHDNFYPRPPRGGRPEIFHCHAGHRQSFLSTSPAWGTTCGSKDCRRLNRHFYPRPPRGGRHFVQLTPHAIKTTISIHVPRVGDDSIVSIYFAFAALYFYPRPPRGGRRRRR